MVMLSPGVYPREIDFSSYVQQLSTSVCGLVGVFTKGPLGATLVTSWAKFVELYGTYNSSYEGAHLAKMFFDNGGTNLYVSRVVHYASSAPDTAAKATKTLKDTKAVTPADTIRVDAISMGAWGNSIYVAIAAADGQPTDYGFDLVVYYGGTADANIVETFPDLVMDYSSDDYFARKINGISKYITVTDLLSTTTAPDNVPAVLAATALATGNDGLTSLADTDYIGDSAGKNGIFAFDAVDELSLLIVADEGDNPDVVTAALSYCEGRKDVFFIGAVPAASTTTTACDFRNGTGTYSHAKFNSSYGALYYPLVVINDPLTSDEKTITPVGALAGMYANNDAVANVWSAPAGIDRGKLRNVLRAERIVDKGERDTLYAAGINPIATFATSGLVVWGNKNLAVKASALDRINVRRLMIYVEKAIVRASEQFVFEPANPKTWSYFTRTVTPFLRGILNGGGFYDFLVVCDATTNPPEVVNANQMMAKIYVQPTKTAEFIGIDFTIMAYGASFTETV